MTEKTIAFACDHAGVALKAKLMETLKAEGWIVLNLGTDSEEPVDYPDYANKLVAVMKEGKAKWGVLICATGIGIAIAANRHPGMRAAVCHDITTARLARTDDDANILVLGARVLGHVVATDCLRTFLETPFAGGRHARRVEKLG